MARILNRIARVLNHLVVIVRVIFVIRTCHHFPFSPWRTPYHLSPMDRRHLNRRSNQQGALRNNNMGKQRSKMLCVVAYDGDKIIAVSTVSVYVQPNVYVKAANFRCLVRPEYRKRKIATELALRCAMTTEEWSKENPDFKVMCFAIRVETQILLQKCRQPVWADKMVFVGYSEQGMPLYVYWYKHACIGEEQDPDYTFYPIRGAF